MGEPGLGPYPIKEVCGAIATEGKRTKYWEWLEAIGRLHPLPDR